MAVGRAKASVDRAVQASDDAVMRKAMLVSPSKMAASAVEENRPDNVDRMLAETKPGKHGYLLVSAWSAGTLMRAYLKEHSIP